MKLRISTLLLLGGIGAALSISSLPAKESPSPEATQKLAQALQGRTQGPPAPCIANLRGRAEMSVIDDTTILFREGSTVYVQKPNGGCPSLGNGRYALVKRQVGSTRYCEGDIGEVVDPVSGFFAGSCVFGPFVPYRTKG
jgi:hypothetical protein